MNGPERWNDPQYRDDPQAPWNDPRRRDDPDAPWNGASPPWQAETYADRHNLEASEREYLGLPEERDEGGGADG